MATLPPLPVTLLIVGSGGREHALLRACQASPQRPRVLVAPGNAGIAAQAPVFPVAADDVAGLVALAQREQVGFVIVGPEVPLSLGLVDALAAVGIPAYGPRADGARLESSKVFTKEILLKYGLPTAAGAVFTEVAPALDYVRGRGAPIVIKADGLAAGKGVVVAATVAEAEAAILAMLSEGRFGAAGRQILIEDCLFGEETSLLVVVSGRDYVILPTAQDHKRLGEGDTGPNTGGMGTYSPAEVVTPALLERIERTIVRPAVDAIAAEGIDFRGTLFIGLMLTAEGPSVLEFNTRFGDPETQVILPRLDTDLPALLWAATLGQLAAVPVRQRPEHALCVVLAATGYPEAYARGVPLRLPESATLPPGVHLDHAGTARDVAGQLVTAGGRVLGVTALAPTLAEAAAAAYAACALIASPALVYRRDIGARQLLRG